MEVYADMQAAGVEITVQAFNAVIDVCARCGDVERAAAVFREMCLRVTPDLTTYATIIKGYCVQGDLEQAIQLFALMPACVSTGHVARAAEVFAKIKSPDAKAFTTLIHGYLKHQDVPGALRVLESALAQRVQVEQELIDNVLFMANRRKLDTSATPLVAKLAAGSLPARAQEEQPVSRFHARRKQGQNWRDSQ